MKKYVGKTNLYYVKQLRFGSCLLAQPNIILFWIKYPVLNMKVNILSSFKVPKLSNTWKTKVIRKWSQHVMEVRRKKDTELV